MSKDQKPARDPTKETGDGKQMDDNIDDLGRKPDGTRQDQPGATKPSKGTRAFAKSARGFLSFFSPQF